MDLAWSLTKRPQAHYSVKGVFCNSVAIILPETQLSCKNKISASTPQKLVACC